MAAEGQQAYQKLIDAGYSAQDAGAWRDQQTQKLRAGGFDEKAVADYWGEGEANTSPMDNLIKNNHAANWSPEMAHTADPNSWSENLAAGFDMSVSSLALRGAPKTIAPEQSGFTAKLMQGLGQFTGDLPATIAGLVGGAAGGATVTSETGPGAIGGGLVGGGFGSAALPEAIRQTYMDQYQNGGYKSFSDTMSRAAHIAYNTMKQGAIGAVSSVVGGIAGAKVLSATGSQAIATASELTGYATTATTANAALEGKVPDASDFVSGLVLMAGFHTAHALYSRVGAQGRLVPTADGEKIVKNMQDIYARTGVPPWEQAQRAASDPVYRQDIMSRDASGNAISHNFKADGPQEPEPYKPRNTNAHAIQDEHDAEVSHIASEAFERFGQKPEEQLDIVRHLERSGDSAVSPTGAVGRYQIEPGTAIQYGFDPARLKDPVYNERVAKTILADLAKRYKKADGSTDIEAVLIAYNAGPGRANVFRANGRQIAKLPLETQRYLEHADRLGALDGSGGGKEPPPPGNEPGATEPPDGGKPNPFDLNEEMLTSKINDSISNPPKASLFDKAKTALNRAKFDAVSELAPFERLDKTLGTTPDEMGVADQFRQVYGSVGRAYHMLEYGTVDPVTFEKTGNDALIPAYKAAAEKGSLDEFKAYRQALRTLELARTGRKSIVDQDVAQALVQKLGRKYAPEVETIRRVNDAKVDYYQQSGMLNAEGAAALKANNRDWYPQIPEKEGVVAAKRGSRFGPRQVIKKAEGHGNLVLDPATQEIKSFYSMAAVADKNRAVVGLVNALSKGEMGELGIRMLPDKTTKPEIFDKDGNLIPDALDNTGPLKLGDKEFSYFENGMRKVGTADDPQLAEAIRGISPIKPEATLSTLRWFAALKRSGITDMPDFMARAMAKDAVGAAILSKWGGVPFANSIRGLFHLSKADPVFQEFVRNGGFGAALSDMDANYVARDLHRLNAETGMLDQVVNRVAHPLETAQLLMQRMDMATRIGIYKRAQDAGLPNFKAGVEARKGTLDFQEKAAGQLTNAFAGMTPFYRPSILGLKQMYEAFTQRPVATAAKSALYIAAPTAILYAINYMQDQDLPENEKFANLPRWQKDTMFILPSINGVRLRLPMPPILGTLVGGMTNRVLDHFAKSDPRAFKDWAGTALAQLLPPVLPAAVAPIAEHMANYNSFSGHALVPSSLEDSSNYMQYTPSTSETSKQLARLLGPPNMNLANVSPIVVDNYVREWTGAMGMTALKVVGGFMQDKGKPTELADNPFIGSFIVRNGESAAAPITDFYDAMDTVTAAHRDLALAIKQQDMSLIQYNAGQVQAFLNMGNIRQALTAQRGAIDAITANKDMTKDEKRQQIDSIYSGMIQTAKLGLQVIDTVNNVQDQ